MIAHGSAQSADFGERPRRGGSFVIVWTSRLCCLAFGILALAIPVPLLAQGTSGPVVTAISAGAAHSLFLLSNGAVGASGYNLHGQLGDGTTSNRSTPVQVMTGVASISASGNYSLFLKTDGTVWASGYNFDGQLGDGSKTSRSTPVQVMSGVSAISAGGSHSLFLKPDGTVWACGSNTAGKLGDGSATTRTTPVQVSISGVAAICAGGTHSLFLKADGTVWACGNNFEGQFGNGTKTNQSTPVQVMSGVAAIAAGASHSLFLKTDGVLWASGNNYNGQLGIGSSNNSQLTPVQVMSGVTAVSAGGLNSFFLKSDGTAWASGYNSDGQLGNGSAIDLISPQLILSGVATVSTGGSHVLFLKNDGVVWAAGNNGVGQLGDGTTSNSRIPVSASPVSAPVLALSAGLSFGNVAVGQTATRTLTIANTGNSTLNVTAIGYPSGFSGNWSGGTIAAGGSRPVTVTFAPIAEQGYGGTLTVASNASSGANTLSISGAGVIPAPALSLSGNLSFGNVAIGQATTRTLTIANPGNWALAVNGISYPTGFSGNWSGGTIAAGGSQDVTVTFSPAAAQSYGGALTVASNATSGENTLSLSGTGVVPAPAIALSGSLSFGGVTVGQTATLTFTIANTGTAALSVTGLSYPAGFGGNWSGGTIPAGASQAVTVTFSPTAAQSYGGTLTVASNAASGSHTLSLSGTGVRATTGGASAVTAVSAGYGHSLFLLGDGSAWACGRNSDGQLGDGTTMDRSTPVRVMGGVSAISAGGGHSLFLKTDGTVWAAGRNAGGQLGDGTTVNRNTPVPVMSGVSAISAGGAHSLFLKTDGTAWASGWNADGRLGDGTTSARQTPVQSLSGVIAISAGNEHSLFIKTDGTAWGAGDSWSAIFVNQGTPLQVLTSKSPLQALSGVSALSAATVHSTVGDHSLFLKSDGSVWATGWNAEGQLGDGTKTNRTQPVAVQVSISGVKAVSAGNRCSMFLKNDGTAWACGENGLGAFGNGAQEFNITRTTPVQVGSGISAISAGGGHTLFLKTDGTAWAAGANSYGELGDGTHSLRSTPVRVKLGSTSNSPTQSQTITFAQPAAATFGDDPVTLSATASSGLPVAFELVSTTPAGIATLNGDTLAILGAGKATVRAVQPGAYPIKAAPAVTRTITINKAPLAVSFEPATRLVGQPNPAFTRTYEGFVNGDDASDLDLAPRGATKAAVTSPAGQYAITFTGGADNNYRFVAGEPAFLTVEGFGGAYEALLVDASGIPRGKLEILVPNNALTFTGTLNLASLPAALSLRGGLTASDGTFAQASWSPAPATGISGLSLGFEITGDTLDGELALTGASPSSLSIASGSRVFVQPIVAGKKQNAPWTGLHTLVLRDPVPLSESDTRALPLGAGHASVSVAATGVMTLKGKLADGSALTGSAKPDADGLYRVYLRPYAKRLGSFLSGELPFVSHPDQTRFPSRYLVEESDSAFFWAKAESPAKPLDPSYRTGFATKVSAALDPWLPPARATATSAAITLPERLGLLAPGSGTDAPVSLEFLGAALTPAEILALPSVLTLRANGSIPPPAPNPRAFSLTVTPATGAFSGSFSLSDQIAPPPAKPVTRKATISGTLRQGPDGSADTLGHAHFLLDPVPGDASSEQVSGELILSAPAVAE